jgi:hypothetical protein
MNMKSLGILILIAVTLQPAFAGQTWLCEGKDNDEKTVTIAFETKSNTVISDITVTDLSSTDLSGRVRRDEDYKPTNPRYKNFNRFDISSVGNELKLLLPKRLAKLDDEFSAFLQKNIGTTQADTIQLTCTGI